MTTTTTTTTTTTAAPEYLAADTYTGRTYRTAGKLRVGTFTAQELAAHIGEGGTAPLWESCGHVNGVEQFVRSRFYSTGREIVGYSSVGWRTIIHPADRKVRVLIN